MRAADERREEIIQFLQDLVKIPSPAGEERDIHPFLERKLRDTEMDVDVVEPALEEKQERCYTWKIEEREIFTLI